MKRIIMLALIAVLLSGMASCEQKTDQEKIKGAWKLDKLIVNTKLIYDSQKVDSLIQVKYQAFPKMKEEDSLFIMRELRSNILQTGKSEMNFETKTVTSIYFQKQDKIEKKGRYKLDVNKKILEITDLQNSGTKAEYEYNLNDPNVLELKDDLNKIQMSYSKK